jgi:hypothetical protein
MPSAQAINPAARERHGGHVRVVDAPLAFEHRKRCAYQATFDYLERHAA